MISLKNDLTRQILSLTHLDATLSNAEIARKLGCHENTVRRQVNSIIDSGYFIRRASVNVGVVGLREFNIYFSFNSENLNQRNKVLQSIVNHADVKWLLEVASSYDCLMAVMAKSFVGVAACFEGIFKEYGDFIRSKQVFGVISYYYFGRRYFAPGVSERRFIAAEAQNEAYQLDREDGSILQALTDSSFESMELLARRVEMPVSTVKFRVKRMSDVGVVNGMIMDLQEIFQQLSVYRVLLYLAGDRASLLEKLIAFAEKNERVVYIVKTLGAWDYELQYETLHAKDILNLKTELVSVLGATLLKVEVLPVLAIRKPGRYTHPIT